MSTSKAPLVEVDWAAFDPWRIQQLRHRLCDHPLLQIDQLVELGKRLETNGRIRSHSNEAAAGTPFNSAPRLHRNRKSAAETLENIRDAKAWMSLMNVQSDPLYRTLVDQVLDDVQPQIERLDPGMCYRGGWIFVTSPNTVTPFHFDTEHGILMQIHGRKTIYVWDHTDTVVASEHARDKFFASHSRDLLTWRDEFKTRAHKFEVAPGVGVYNPCTSPHLVETGPEPSITMSFTFYTNSTRRKALLHRMHQNLREHGIKPKPVGEQPRLDTLLHGSGRALLSMKHGVLRLAGKEVLEDSARYAHASFA